jgi:hypothetical protein
MAGRVLLDYNDVMKDAVPSELFKQQSLTITDDLIEVEQQRQEYIDAAQLANCCVTCPLDVNGRPYV